MDESWLIPYADILTLLLALFIVLYSMSSVDAKKFEELSQAFSLALNSGSGVLDSPAAVRTGDSEELPKDHSTMEEDGKDKDKDKEKDTQTLRAELMKKEQADLEKLKKQLDQYIKKNGLTTELATKLNQSQLMITISDNALFASGSSSVKPESRELAAFIGTMLQQYPDYEIIVSGHTDNQAISTSEFKSNWDLSSSRAIRFMDILLENKSIKPARFSAIGYGEYRPVDSNSSDVGRSKNRRVEVSIIRKYVDQENMQQIPATPKG